MTNSRPQEIIPEWSDEGRREFTAAMQIKFIGNLSAAAKRFAASLDYYRKVTAEIHFQIGDCYYKQNNWVRAVEHFNVALHTDPDHARARDRLKSCRHLVRRSAEGGE